MKFSSKESGCETRVKARLELRARSELDLRWEKVVLLHSRAQSDTPELQSVRLEKSYERSENVLRKQERLHSGVQSDTPELQSVRLEKS